jgi:hypothetical protein
METILGLLGLTLYIIAILGISMGITLAVVKISPSQSAKQARNDTSA